MIRRGRIAQLNLDGPWGVVAGTILQAIYDTRSNDPVVAAEADYHLRCPETMAMLDNLGIESDYFKRLLKESGV